MARTLDAAGDDFGGVTTARGPEFFLPPTTGVDPTSGHPIYDWNQAASQLTRFNLQWNATDGLPITITYGFRATDPGDYPVDAGDFSRFNAAQIAAAEEALSLWADVANITFVRVGTGTTGETAYTDSATILFSNFSSGLENSTAFGYYPGFGATADAQVQGDVWINLQYDDNLLTLGSTGFGAHTLEHEIGHALGLFHPGDYDSAAGGNPTYAADAVYWQDTRMFTVMSYFGSSGTGGNPGGFATGPQLHDIAAIQLLYGANMTTRIGNTTYGFNANAGHAHYAIATSADTGVFSIWDAGGNDTLDLSGYNSNSEIDLREESFSSAGPGNPGSGGAVYNISIARGAVIENAIGGGGGDTIIGNAAANQFTGNGGNDNIAGGLGIDRSNYTLASTASSWHRNADGSWTVTSGTAGADTLSSVEIAHFSDRNVVLDQAQQSFFGNGASDLLWRNSVSGGVAMWEVAGATQTFASMIGGAPSQWSIEATGDFNGDGKDDILWRNSVDGGVAAWLQNGASSISQTMIGGAPLEWTIAGVGDFNFDGKDDLVWRNTSDGGVAVWLQNGTSSISQTMIGGAPLDWSIVAVADFDGDGKDDLLWRHAGDGVIARWVTDGAGAGTTSASIVGSRPSNWIVAGAGDFDGDGRADILWRNSTDGAAAIWLMDGGARTGGGSIGAAPTDWSIVQVGDFNADGKDDILWRHDTDGLLVFWQMNGTTVSSQTTYGVVPTDWHLI